MAADEERTVPPAVQRSEWQADWESHRRHRLTFALEATPAQRLAWLEEMIALAHRTGALPRPRRRS